MDDNKLMMQEVPAPTYEEQLAEAQAWGFDSVEDYDQAMDEVMAEYDEDQQHG